LGSLIGLGILASHSELIAMRAAGVSVKSIARAVAVSSMAFIVLSYSIGIYLGPVLQHTADIRRALLTSTDQAVLMSASATWLKDGNSFTYIDKTTPSGQLLGVTRYEIDHYQLQKIINAASADYVNQHWILHQVVELDFSKNHLSKAHYDSAELSRLVPPALLKVIITTPQYLTLPGLWSFIQYQKHNGLDVTSDLLQFWSILLQPLAIVILMVMAVPFVFGPLRSAAMSLRMIVGVILGFVFFIITQLFGPFSSLYSVPPFLGAMLPIILFATILYIMLKRMS